MSGWLLLQALVLGLVEGLTEFLPVSSTGHLILAGRALGFRADALGQAFEVFIQLGAILAVCWEYRARLLAVAGGLPRDPAARAFAARLLLAFLPVAAVGLAAAGWIKGYLFRPLPVALAFVLGGLVILWVEARQRRRPPRVLTVDAMGWREALWVGLAQVAALVPGTSRSGATIVGGMLAGLSRRAATEFSFFLAIPVMLAASGYELLKAWPSLDGAYGAAFAVGFAAAFLSAFAATRALLRFVSRHTLAPFAWYRIAFGLLLLAVYREELLGAWA
ncbi:MAG: undecaprenyl-diphosphate phosphatase [Gammaproteobacteria bacterium]|nr:MAG: undecaprenyl-diphosphate phosphatase [Gammaproteobacteria bacterium]